MVIKYILRFILFSLLLSSCKTDSIGDVKFLDSMKMNIPVSANRSISFTNKESAYYYMQSHETNHPEYSWFEGMNIAKNRIFGGYNLYSDGQLLDPCKADVWVYPYKMVRQFSPTLYEEFWMIDYKNILDISLIGASNRIEIELKGRNVKFKTQSPEIAFYSSMEGNYVIAICSKDLSGIEIRNNHVITNAIGGGFYIAVAKSENEASCLIRETKENLAELKNERIKRMTDFLLVNTYVKSNIDSLDLALNWLETTMNQLITKQQGEGIYAGLPWFNEYWGRDEFISFPGAILVSGQFETGRKILKSFAMFQERDSSSKFFGRVPNIVNPQNIDYHTTDGTPRFIIELENYVKYSGDTSIIRELYSTVVNSIEGALKHWVDKKGYLLHEDNETWMDARDQNLKPYSPRGSRANDIQALWYNQLQAGIYFARFMCDRLNADKWSLIAAKVKRNFEYDFRSEKYPFLADRLTKEGEVDFTLRPNQLFAFDMIEDDDFKSGAIRTVWNELVYPWGVATLDKKNRFFHPFHLANEYHKDEAYHNGTIWPWLNGIAMQRMIEAEEYETSFKLFKNMNWQALNLGVVGGISENLDAYPHSGMCWPKLTGTYLQAWSNAEQLRIWHQWFLGIRPDLANNYVIIAPRIPHEINSLDYRIILGKGYLTANYRANKVKKYIFKFNDIAVNAMVDIFPYETKVVAVEAGMQLKIIECEDNLQIYTLDKNGAETFNVNAKKSIARIKQNQPFKFKLDSINFSMPDNLNSHSVLKR